MCSIRCFLRRASVSLPPTKHGIDSSANAQPALPRESITPHARVLHASCVHKWIGGGWHVQPR
jgi:hypothetical protein